MLTSFVHSPEQQLQSASPRRRVCKKTGSVGRKLSFSGCHLAVLNSRCSTRYVSELFSHQIFRSRTDKIIKFHHVHQLTEQHSIAEGQLIKFPWHAYQQRRQVRRRDWPRGGSCKEPAWRRNNNRLINLISFGSRRYCMMPQNVRTFQWNFIIILVRSSTDKCWNIMVIEYYS